MIYTKNVSTEPLEIIRANECDQTDGGLATSRFRALWNEIERLREQQRAATVEDALKTPAAALEAAQCAYINLGHVAKFVPHPLLPLVKAQIRVAIESMGDREFCTMEDARP